MPVWTKLSGDHPGEAGEVGQCNYIILVSPGLDVFECNPTCAQLQMWALTQIWNARDTPSTVFQTNNIFNIFYGDSFLKSLYVGWCCKDWRQIEAFCCWGILIWTLLWLLTNLNLSSGAKQWMAVSGWFCLGLDNGGGMTGDHGVIMGHDWYLIHSYQLWSRIFNVKQNINHVSIRRIECGDSATDTHN